VLFVEKLRATAVITDPVHRLSEFRLGRGFAGSGRSVGGARAIPSFPRRPHCHHPFVWYDADAHGRRALAQQPFRRDAANQAAGPTRAGYRTRPQCAARAAHRRHPHGQPGPVQPSRALFHVTAGQRRPDPRHDRGVEAHGRPSVSRSPGPSSPGTI
jgi:hypothetical protein